jgi:hypothetical protein
MTNDEPGRTGVRPKTESDQAGSQDKRRAKPNRKPGQRRSQTKRGVMANGDPGQTGRQALCRVRRTFLQNFCRVESCAESQHYQRVDVTIDPTRYTSTARLLRCKGHLANVRPAAVCRWCSLEHQNVSSCNSFMPRPKTRFQSSTHLPITE